MTRTTFAALAVMGLTGGLGAAGCSSPTPTPDSDGCVDSTSAALRKCATGTTVTGVDVSAYQGAVEWSRVKSSGQVFAFARISDGLNYPDRQFASNWPGMKAVGLVRGSYQYFRPKQDPSLQAKLVLDKLAAAGGLGPGDLPPVLDLETTDGLSASVVVANAKTWIAKIEAAIGAKPIVYTAAFMSDVLGTNFSGYTLWVANYGVSCPSLPSGFSDWQFWQNSDTGSVPGIAGGVDTNFFNGTLAALTTYTLKAPSGGAAAPVDPVRYLDPGPVIEASEPEGGSTLGHGPAPDETQSLPFTPCR